jgi:hypothetical protein
MSREGRSMTLDDAGTSNTIEVSVGAQAIRLAFVSVRRGRGRVEASAWREYRLERGGPETSSTRGGSGSGPRTVLVLHGYN